MKTALKWVGVCLAVALVFVIVVFLMRLVTAPVHLAGTALSSAQGVVSKTLDPNNVISNYEWYHDAWGQLQARQKQIWSHRDIVSQTKDQAELSRLRIELAAIQQSCRDLASRYNANATKSNRSIFMGREAPSDIPSTYCE